MRKAGYIKLRVKGFGKDEVSELELNGKLVGVAFSRFIEGCIQSATGEYIFCYGVASGDSATRIINERGRSCTVNIPDVQLYSAIENMDGLPAYITELKDIRENLRINQTWMTDDWELLKLLASCPLLTSEIFKIDNLRDFVLNFSAEDIRLLIRQWIDWLFDMTLAELSC